MISDLFSDVTAWVFDLDNTLYPPSVRLFDQIEEKMRAYVADLLSVTRTEADHLRKEYWRRYGTTLAGLMAEHDVDPDPYLVQVHDIDFSVLPADPDLADAIGRLPGRRIVYTNGSAPYARNVLAARGLGDLFDAVYGIEDAGYRPKPQRSAFEAIFARDGLTARGGAMFEDDPRNLAAPHEMGMKTVLVSPDGAAAEAAHVHHHTDDLSAFLSQLV